MGERSAGEGVLTVRFKDPGSVPPLEDVWIALLCGPMRGHEWEPELMAEMEAGWWAHRDKILEEYGDRPSKPWGWWVFEAKEPMPDHGAEAARLAELSQRKRGGRGPTPSAG